MHKIKGYGWKRGLPVYGHPKFEKACMAATPARADITSQMPSVIYDQGDLGSCTANAAAALAEFLTVKNGWKDYMPARLAIYYWEREIDGVVEDDAGSSLTNAAKVLHTKGAPNEVNWPYDITKFTRTPTTTVRANGAGHIVTDPLQVKQSLDDIRACISFGFPIMYGFTVYESFESDAVAKSGILTMPKSGEQIVGGHAVVIVGYDDYTKMVKVRNSWGPLWGQKGHFWMPYDYVADPDLCDDFWTAHKMTGWKPHK